MPQNNNSGYTRKQKKQIEARYLRNKNLKNYSVNDWKKEEKRLLDKLYCIEEELKKSINQDRTAQLKKQRNKYIEQLRVCSKHSEKAMKRQIEEKNKNEKIQEIKCQPIGKIEENTNEDISNAIEMFENHCVTKVENTNEKIEQRLKEEAEKIIAQAEQNLNEKAKNTSTQPEIKEENKEINDENESKVNEDVEKSKKDTEAKVKEETEVKKGFWTRCKEKVSKGWKKMVGPILATIAIGAAAQPLLNSPQQDDKLNTVKINEIDKQNASHSQNKPRNVENFKENLKIDENEKNDENNQEQKYTLGDIVYIQEGCNYYENSFEGGNHNTVDTKNQWRQAGDYMIDGLAVTYKDNDENWKIAKLKDDKTNGGNYGNLGLDSQEYISVVMQQNGLTKEQIRVMYHINQGKIQGEHPTGWIEAPKEGFEIESKYQEQQKIQETDESMR